MKARHTPEILELGNAFYEAVLPAPFPQATPRFLNKSKALWLGLQELSENDSAQEWVSRAASFKPWRENLQQCLALKYHGHQFRHYNPDLGDGRGFVYAQFRAPDNKLYDLGTKGSGKTPYSRGGDGRLTLKGAMREALATEMLESLGVTTSKTFCFFETGEALERNDEPSPTRSAVLTRLSLGHIRIGTFQRLAYLQEKENLLKLLNYSCEKFYPELISRHALGSQELAEAFLRAVTENLAKLTAQYMMAGFVHGVLNSDNINISGESFDYGPYRFLPHYDPLFTAAYFDHGGLYSFGRQPQAIFWNLNQLAASLSFAFPDLKAKENLEAYGDRFSGEVIDLFFQRLNLKRMNDENDDILLKLFFDFISSDKEIFYEQTFFDLFGCDPDRLEKSPQKRFYDTEFFLQMKVHMSQFEVADLQKMEHPYFQSLKPCSLLIDEIEAIWKEIAEKDDWSAFENKIAHIRSMRGIY